LSLGGLLLVLCLRYNSGDEILGIVVLGVEDSDGIGHDLLVGTLSDLDGLHDLNLDTDHTLTELDVADGLVDEIVLRLTSGDLVTHSVLLGLSTLSTNLTGNDDFATDGLTLAHNSAHDVVGGITHGGTSEELELEVLAVGSGAKSGVILKRLDGELKLVAVIVEVVALLDERFNLLDLAVGLGKHLLGVGAADTDLSGHAGGADLDTGVSLFTESTGKELVELSAEDSVSNKLLLGVDLLYFGLSGHAY